MTDEEIRQRMLLVEQREAELKIKAQKVREMYKPFERFESTFIADGGCFGFIKGDTCRCMMENNTIFVYGKGRRTYGKRLSDTEFCRYFAPKVAKKRSIDENEKWHRSLRNILKHLDKSKLWPSIYEEVSILLNITFEEFKILYEYRWAFREIGPAMQADVQRLKQKYPMICNATTSNGLRNSLFTEMYYRPRLKSMNFGSMNDYYKSQIAQALAERRSYSTGRVRCNYDVSFEYNAEKSAAWYSEEYKDCGNGHYYLALDGGTALFCEDD